jgi:hypothetical protein
MEFYERAFEADEQSRTRPFRSKDFAVKQARWINSASSVGALLTLTLKRFAAFDLDVNRYVAPGTNHTRVGLKPSKGLTELVATYRAL